MPFCTSSRICFVFVCKSLIPIIFVICFDIYLEVYVEVNHDLAEYANFAFGEVY
jgi:hypothetical protein